MTLLDQRLPDPERILGSMIEAVIVTDAELERPGPRIVYVNEAFEKLTGYPAEEILGRTPRLLQGPRTDPELLRSMKECLRRDLPFEGETFNYRKDGTEYLVRWYILPLRDDAEEVTHYVAVQRDVTRQFLMRVDFQRLARAMRDLEEPVAIMSANGRLLQTNRAFDKIAWGAAEKLQGALHYLDPEASDALFQHLLVGEPWNGDLRIATKDGRELVLRCTLSPLLSAQGRESVLVARDDTARRRIERIASALNMTDNVGYVFAGIRHELGNPVNSVKAALSVLKGRAETIDREQLRDYLDDILGEIQRMEFLLDALRGYSRIDRVRLQEVELEPFLRRFGRLVEHDARGRGATLSVEVEPDAVARADPRALHQVLLNLVTNALDAVRGRDAPEVRIQVERRPGRVVLRVEDNGSGMSDEQLDRLFQPFQSEKPGGSGLGMVIVQRLLAQMHGTIDVQSRPGVGTTIRVGLDSPP